MLVADFANTTGDAVFDDALRQAVAVQLQQSPFLTLLPDQRVQRTLRLMQRQPEERLSSGRSRAKSVSAPAPRRPSRDRLPRSASSYVITLGVHNCQTGESLAEQQVQASSKEDVLKQLGVAVTQLRPHLGESLASMQKYDVPVTEATTTSLDALRAYGQAVRARTTKRRRGVDSILQAGDRRAIRTSRSRTRSSASSPATSGRSTKRRRYAKKAYSLRDHVSEYERLYINWNYASRVHAGSRKATKEALELLTAAYPRDFAARNNFGVYYNNQGAIRRGAERIPGRDRDCAGRAHADHECRLRRALSRQAR